MLYISKLGLEIEKFEEIIEAVFEEHGKEEYTPYDVKPFFHLPLPVSSLIYSSVLAVNPGYTVTSDSVIYANDKGDMVGLFDGLHNDGGYFFMSGTRQGIASILDKLPQKEIGKYQTINKGVRYIAEDDTELPFNFDIIEVSENIPKRVWPVKEHTLDIAYLHDAIATLNGNEYVHCTNEVFLQELKCRMVYNSDEIPTDITDIDLSNITFSQVTNQELPTMSVGPFKVTALDIIESGLNSYDIISSEGLIHINDGHITVSCY